MLHQIHDNKTDQELLEFYHHDKNNEWLGILLNRYSLLLLGLCMKYLKNEDDAKDAVQQIFIKVINELHKYEVTYFKSWLYMVAKNHCLMELRKNKNKSLELNETIYDAGDDVMEMSLLMQKEQTLNLLSECISLLNEEQKLCITLFYLDRKSYNEIAGSTGYTVMQVKSHIQNGKRNLKLMIEKKQHGG